MQSKDAFASNCVLYINYLNQRKNRFWGFFLCVLVLIWLSSVILLLRIRIWEFCFVIMMTYTYTIKSLCARGLYKACLIIQHWRTESSFLSTFARFDWLIDSFIQQVILIVKKGQRPYSWHPPAKTIKVGKGLMYHTSKLRDDSL